MKSSGWKLANTNAKIYTTVILLNSTLIYCVTTSVSVAWWIITTLLLTIGIAGIVITHLAYKKARKREAKVESEYFIYCCRVNERTDREQRAREAREKQMCANPYANEHTYLYANGQAQPKDEDGTEPKMKEN